jgi:endonuclease IV
VRSPNIINIIKSRIIGWAERETDREGIKMHTNFLVRIHEGNSVAERSRSRWEDNMINLKQIGLEDVNCTVFIIS